MCKLPRLSHRHLLNESETAKAKRAVAARHEFRLPSNIRHGVTGRALSRYPEGRVGQAPFFRAFGGTRSSGPPCNVGSSISFPGHDKRVPPAFLGGT